MKLSFYSTKQYLRQKNADSVLFLMFLCALPLSIRKVLWFIPLQGGFNEYSDISIYLSDILILGLLATYVLLGNKKRQLSILYECFTWNKMKDKGQLSYLFLPFLFIIWSAISLLWAKSLPIGLFFLFKLVELYFLYLFIIFRVVPRETSTDNTLLLRSIFIIVGIGSLEALIGILQFILQHSLGLSILKESVVNPNLPGVAKIVFQNNVFIRSYGTFPHPNILGGFLAVSIVLTSLLSKLFHVKQNKIIIQYVFIIQCLGLLLTFSKSAIIGLGIALIYLYFRGVLFLSEARGLKTVFRFRTSDKIKNANVSQLTTKSEENKVFLRIRSLLWNKYSLFVSRGTSVLKGVLQSTSKTLWKITGGIVISIGLVWFFLGVNLEMLFVKSLLERQLYLQIAMDIVHKHTFLGISCGQFVFFISKSSIYPLFSWQLQPVHNVFLLIWTEVGLIGFSIFSLFFVLIANNKLPAFRRLELAGSKEKPMPYKKVDVQSLILSSYYFKAIVIGFIPALLFDHYLWDIQQGQLLFWLILGFFVGIQRLISNDRMI